MAFDDATKLCRIACEMMEAKHADAVQSNASWSVERDGAEVTVFGPTYSVNYYVGADEIIEHVDMVAYMQQFEMLFEVAGERLTAIARDVFCAERMSGIDWKESDASLRRRAYDCSALSRGAVPFDDVVNYHAARGLIADIELHTATGTKLDKLAAAYGVERKPATRAEAIAELLPRRDDNGDPPTIEELSVRFGCRPTHIWTFSAAELSDLAKPVEPPADDPPSDDGKRSDWVFLCVIGPGSPGVARESAKAGDAVTIELPAGEQLELNRPQSIVIDDGKLERNRHRLAVADRIAKWRGEEGGDETEDYIALLCDAEEALRGRPIDDPPDIDMRDPGGEDDVGYGIGNCRPECVDDDERGMYVRHRLGQLDSARRVDCEGDHPVDLVEHGPEVES